MTEVLTQSVTFKDFDLKSELIQAVEKLGYEIPTEVQARSIPILLESETDFIGLAQTGTGKTAAFGLPMLNLIDLSIKKPQALVLLPTRELCMQVTGELQKLSEFMEGIRIEAVYGGAFVVKQAEALRRGVHVIVATPGRLLDQINRGNVKLSEIKQVILDEADKMLEMGFEEDVHTILENVDEERKIWLFSATMPQPIRHIANRYMDQPKEISVVRTGGAADNLSHQFYLSKPSDKLEVLQRIIDLDEDIYGLIFTRTRAEAQDVAEELIKNGYNADALHGDLQQQQRERVMKMFREKTLQLLVATDVAARGLDVQNVTHVLHFGLPDDVDTYIHRAGRTARAGKSGVSAAVTTPSERSKMETIERLIKTKFERQIVPNAEKIVEKRLVNFIDQFKSAEIDQESITRYIPHFEEGFQEFTKEELIERLCWSQLSKLLEYYQDAKDLNITQQNKKSEGRNSRERDSSGESRYQRFFINIGTKDGLNKRSFVDWLSKGSRLAPNHIHRVDMQPSFSFFEVFADEAYLVIKRMNDISFHNRIVSVQPAESQSGNRTRSAGSGNFGNNRFDRSQKDFSGINRRTDTRRDSGTGQTSFSGSNTGQERRNKPKEFGSQDFSYSGRSFDKAREGDFSYRKKDFDDYQSTRNSPVRKRKKF